MSENNYQDEAKIAKLPKEGVHCFPANAKQISTRRIVTVILTLVFLGVSFARSTIGLERGLQRLLRQCDAADYHR